MNDSERDWNAYFDVYAVHAPVCLIYILLCTRPDLYVCVVGKWVWCVCGSLSNFYFIFFVCCFSTGFDTNIFIIIINAGLSQRTLFTV